MIPRTLFSDDHEIFRASVRRFIAQHIVPFHGQWQKDGFVPEQAWRAAGAAGLLCPGVAEEFGGAGADFLYSAIVIEELAFANVPDVGFYTHSDIAAPYIDAYGTTDQKRQWLPRLVSGEARVALAMTEPSAGSDVAGIATRARREGDGYILNGQKVFISLGSHAELFVVACKTDPEAGAKGISLFLVEGDRPGFVRGRRLEKIGFKAQDTVEIFLQDVEVPAANLLGEENRGFAQMMALLPQERLVQAVRAVTAAECYLQWTIDYTRGRKAFGKTIADLQATQFKFAEMKTDITAQRVFVDRCMELHLAHALDAVDAAMVKLSTTEMQGRVADQCLQLFGGWGYVWEQPIARAFVDARVARIAGGSTDVMKHIIGRALVRS